MMEDSPKQVPGAPTRFITSLMPPRSSSAILLARACSPPSATSSRVAMAAAAHTGLGVKGVEGAVRGHALRAIPQGIATRGHGRQEQLLPTHGGPGEPARHDLGEGGEVRSDAEVLLGAAGRVAEARDHLVEDQYHVVPLGQRAQFL